MTIHKIRETDASEPVVEWWLEVDEDGEVCLTARAVGGADQIVAWIDGKGLNHSVIACRKLKAAIPVDAEGRIKVAG